MAVNGIRFRTEGTLVVLQVNVSIASRGYRFADEEIAEWRDAKVEDLLDVSKFTEANVGRRLDELASQLFGVSERVDRIGGPQ